MKHLINIGALPKRLDSVTPPPCLAYLLGKSKKRPWRSKAPIKPIRHGDPPGYAVLVDQLVSTTPGIKPQATGRLTTTLIVGTQVFADHCSSPPFLHYQLLENFSGEETVRAKVGFE